jgi:polysaccharide export outer membrane protein
MRFSAFVICVCAIAMVGCGRANAPSDALEGNIENYTTEASLPNNYVYRLGAGDRIRVIVFGEDSMSGKFEVSNNGSVSLPYIREVKALGLDISTLEKDIENKYKKEGILKDPKVSVEVLKYRPFYIHGEVTTAGEFPYKSGMDIENAVALAKGRTYRADEDVAFIRREGSSSVYKVNLSSQKSVLIYPGDNILIPERYF